jgi:hypothetical protein
MAMLAGFSCFKTEKQGRLHEDDDVPTSFIKTEHFLSCTGQRFKVDPVI